MKRLQFTILLAGIFCLALQPVIAQQADAPPETKKKVIVIEKVKDADGKVMVEKTIAEGEEADKLILELEEQGKLEKGPATSIVVERERIESADGESVEKKVIIRADGKSKGNCNVEVEDKNGEKHIKIQRPDGTVEEFYLKEGESLPEETKDRLKEEGIYIHDSGDDQMIWHSKGGEQHGVGSSSLFNLNVEEVNGERVIILRQSGDGMEKVMELKGIEGIPEGMKGELAKARFNFDHNFDFAFNHDHVFAYSGYEQNRNCAALGVYVGTSSDQVRINSIIGGSGAEEAGLQAGDVIHSINDQQIVDFIELRKALSQYEPGDLVTVNYERDGITSKVTSELRAWRDLPSMAESYLARINCDDTSEEETIINKRIIIIKTPEDMIDEDVDLGEEEDEDLSPDKSDGILLNQNPAGLDRSLLFSDFKLFPNPSDGNVRVSFQAKPMPLVVKVLDAGGKEVFQEDVKDFDGFYEKDINLTDHVKGSFILMIEQDGKVYSDLIAVQ